MRVRHADMSSFPPPGFVKPSSSAASAAPPIDVRNMSISDFLQKMHLEKYVHDFEEGGWDDVEYLCALSEDQLEEVAISTQMKPGHAQKFVSMVTQRFKLQTPLLALTGTTVATPAAPSSTTSGHSHATHKTYHYAYTQPKPPSQEPATHLGWAYPVGSSAAASGGKRPASGPPDEEEKAIKKQAAKAKARAEALFEKQRQKQSSGKGKSKAPAMAASSSSSSSATQLTQLQHAEALAAAAKKDAERKAKEAERLKKAAEKAEQAAARALDSQQRGAEDNESALEREAREREEHAAAEAAGRARVAALEKAEAERAFKDARLLSACGSLILPGVEADSGQDLRTVGQIVWLSQDENTAEEWGRSGWGLADLRVRITKCDSGNATFDAKAVPPGRYAVSGLPLSHAERVQLSGRELRAAEQSAKRDYLRGEAQLEGARILARRLESLDGEEARAAEAMRLAAKEKAERRTERERLALAGHLPDGLSPEQKANASGECTKLVVRQSVNGGGRVKKDDLAEDLQADVEAVDVWQAAVEIKRKRCEVDLWVRGWRLKMITRQSYGGGADMYIRAPDMAPHEMGNRHCGDSRDTIRSFVHLDRRLRERMQSGASGGAQDTNLVRAAVYVASGRATLELQVVAPDLPVAGSSGGGPSAMEVEA